MPYCTEWLLMLNNSLIEKSELISSPFPEGSGIFEKPSSLTPEDIIGKVNLICWL